MSCRKNLWSRLFAQRRLIEVALGLALSACGSDENLHDIGDGAGGSGPGRAIESSADGVNRGTVVVTDAGTGGTAAGSGGTGTGGAGAAGSGGAGGSGGTFVDDVPTLRASLVCGDGVRDPVKEECDVGVGSAFDACSKNCQVKDFLPDPAAAGTTSVARTLGNGRHPVAASLQGFSVIGIEPDNATAFDAPHDEAPIQAALDSAAARVAASPFVQRARFLEHLAPELASQAAPPRVTASLHDQQGTVTRRLDIAAGTTPAQAANAVLSFLPAGGVAAAWTDKGGDGDELGVALRGWNFATGQLGPLQYVNQRRDFSQFDPDILWTGSELVVGWVDMSDANAPPSLRFRTFDENLKATSDEQALSTSQNTVGNLALATYGNSWVAAYREATFDGMEVINVQTADQSTRYFTGDIHPGPPDDRPAVLELDATHLLVVYTVSTNSDNSGLYAIGRLQGAVINTADLGLQPFNIPPLVAPYSTDPTLSQSHPTAVRVGNEYYVAWRSARQLSGPEAEDLWLKRIVWPPTSGSLPGLTTPEVRLPRWPSSIPGDQRFPALSVLPADPDPSSTSSVKGGALLMAWNDWGRVFGNAEGAPDVAVEYAPMPLVRTTSTSKDCTAALPCASGEAECESDAECQAGLRCNYELGPQFGFGVSTGVCVPLHCTNRVRDASDGETGMDCGGTCGTCPACPPASANGAEDFCSAACRCNASQGDCDFAADCRPGLSCVENIGSQFGFPPAIDVCLGAGCSNGIRDGNETRVDCGGPDCKPCVIEDFCSTAFRCDPGQGDCDANNQCQSGLACGTDNGARWGYAASVDVCMPSGCTNSSPLPFTANACTPCACGAGMGHCGQDAECLSGLVCVPSRGLRFGAARYSSVCLPAHCRNGVVDADETAVDCGGTCGNFCPTLDHFFDDGVAYYLNLTRHYTTAGAQAATATATFANGAVNTSGNPPANTIDGTQLTMRWTTTGTPANALVTLVVDLGATHSISRTKQWYEANSAPATYRLRVSQNNSTWTTVVAAGAAVNGAGGAPETISNFAPVTARYVELQVTGMPASAVAKLNEFYVYPSVEETPAPSVVDGYDISFLPGLTTTVSSTMTTTNSAALYDREATGVTPKTTQNADGTATIDLGSSYALFRIQTYFLSGGSWTRGGKIQISPDQTTWTTIVDSGRNTAFPGQAISFAKQTARYVRITNYFVSGQSPSSVRLDEVGIFATTP